MLTWFAGADAWLQRLLERLLIAVMALLVLTVLWGVVTRFVFSAPSRWTEEVATFLLIWASLVGAAVAFAREEHLGLDYFMNQLDPAAQKLSRLIVQIAVLVFVLCVMIQGGYTLVVETLKAQQVTPALGVRMGYVYLAVPLSGAAMLVSSLGRLGRLLFAPAAVGGSTAEEREASRG